MPVAFASATHSLALKCCGFKLCAISRYSATGMLKRCMIHSASVSNGDAPALPFTCEIRIRTPVDEHSEFVVLKPLDALGVCDLFAGLRSLRSESWDGCEGCDAKQNQDSKNQGPSDVERHWPGFASA